MRPLISFATLAGLFAIQAQGTLLFVNGDPDSYGNFLDCGTCRAAGGVKVYDNFNVPVGGWTVTGILGDYEFFTNSPLPSQAVWEIRQGISQGVSGTLLASGVASISLTPIANPAGVTSVFSYQISASIAPVSLGPGTYWVTLAPNSAANEDFVWATSGVNGTNAVIDGQSFVTGPYWTGMQDIGAYEQPFSHISNYDWAMQLTGSLGTAPEPSSVVLLATGLGLAGMARLRRRR